MIKELGLSLLVLTSINSGVRSPSYRSHEVIEDGMKITYKYETNEVNNANDLVVGNIYYSSTYSDLKASLIIYDRTQDGDITIEVDASNNAYILCTQTGFESYYNGNVLQSYPYGVKTDFYFVYLGDFNGDISKISESDYLPIESVERVYPQNIFGNVSQFIDEQILNGIPNIDSVQFSIGGQDITMRSWLNTTICVVLACLLIGLLLWFIRYLFRLFGGLLS